MQTQPNLELDLSLPIPFEWKPIERISHTYATLITGVWIGMYEHPADKSVWISLAGRAGDHFPASPKKFPDRTSAELWATDTLRLINMARAGEATMSDTSNPEGGPAPDAEPPKPGQQPPFDPSNQPVVDPSEQPGETDDEEIEGLDEDDEDLEDDSTGFDDDED